MAIYNPTAMKAKWNQPQAPGMTATASATNPIVATASANPITFDADTPIGTSNAAWNASQAARGPKAPAAYTPKVYTAQEKEMMAIEKAAKGRLASAQSQADRQRSAMLQLATEKATSQGLDPTSNAAWSMKQRALDQAGEQGNSLLNSALAQNTDTMLAEQDQITQRENSLSDQQRSEKLQILQGIIDNSTDANQRVAAAKELQGLVGLTGSASGSGSGTVDLASAYGTTSSAADKEALSVLSLNGLEATPENIAAIKEGILNKDEENVAALLKTGQYDATKYGAGNSIALAYKNNQKTAKDLTAADWSTLNTKQRNDILSNKNIVRDGNTSWDTWDNVGQGDVVANQGKAYKVVYNPSGKGVYVESLDSPGTFLYFSSDHPGGRETDLKSIEARYNKRHGAGWSISGYSSGPNKKFSSVV